MEKERGLERPVRSRLSVSEGRRFGLTVGVAFGLLASLLAWRSHEYPAYAAAAIGVSLVLGGLLLPARMGPVQAVWMRLAELISRVTNPIILSLIYFLVITPVGLLLRAVKGNPLRRRSSEEGFWVQRSTPNSDLERRF